MLCEVPTCGAFDRKTGSIVGNLTKIFQKSQMPSRGGGGGGIMAFLDFTDT